MKRFILRHQLNAQADSKAEARQLQKLARSLGSIELPSLSIDTKARIAADAGFAYHPHRKAFIRSWEGAIAVLVVLILVFAQSAKPGSALYSIKKDADKVRSILPLVHDPAEPEHQEDKPHSQEQEDAPHSGAVDTKVDSEHGGESSDNGSSGSGGSDDSGSSGTSGSSVLSSHSGGSDDSLPTLKPATTTPTSAGSDDSSGHNDHSGSGKHIDDSPDN